MWVICFRAAFETASFSTAHTALKTCATLEAKERPKQTYIHGRTYTIVPPGPCIPFPSSGRYRSCLLWYTDRAYPLIAILPVSVATLS